MERAHKIRVVVFDKTGTLTLGRPAVTGHALFAAGRLPLDEVLQLACALESSSEHPLAQAILSFTASRCGRFTMRFRSITKVLAERVLSYCRVSLCAAAPCSLQ